MNTIIEKLQLQQNKAKRKRNKPGTGRKPILRQSNYFLTINTNLSKWKMTEKEYDEFSIKWKQILQDFYYDKLPNTFVLLKNSSEENELFAEVPLVKRFETETRIRYCKEVGPKRGLIHNHGVILMNFRALRVKLDYTGIKAWFKEQLGFNVYFNAILFRDDLSNIMNYLSKIQDDY